MNKNYKRLALVQSVKLSTQVMALALAACGSDNDNSVEGDTRAAYEGVYTQSENWMCRPDMEGESNLCNNDLTATLVNADGSLDYEFHTPATNAPVDCFYVYPTVSTDEGSNADRVIGEDEFGALYTQAIRYNAVCQVYAPIYRQVSVASVFNGTYSDEAAQDIAYSDVLDAFEYYLANAGSRGFILMGHSQGSGHLIRLIQEKIEADDGLSKRMISAHLLGMNVAVPNNANVGGSFATTPPCTASSKINCFVNYTSFRTDTPPDGNNATLMDFPFGATADADTRAVCTHPAALIHGSDNGKFALDAYFSPAQVPPFVNNESNGEIATGFVKLPGLFEAECVEEDGLGYLAITINANPQDPRVDDLSDFPVPGWGLHLYDVALAQGDLITLAQQQSDAWLEEND